MDFSRFETRAHKSGMLGERFVEETFGVREGKAYEIKSTGASNGAFVVQVSQLVNSLEKQYIVVHYIRDRKTLKRGPRKGRTVFTETIDKAYQKKLNVYVVRGHRIAELVVRHKLQMYCAAAGGDILKYGKWGLIYRIPRKHMPVEVFEDTERYCLHAYPDDPPAWSYSAPPMQGGLFKDNGVELKEDEADEEDTVPF